MVDTKRFWKLSKPLPANKYVSDFVKKQREISSRMVPRLAWDSRYKNGKGRTYIKKIHGELI